MGLTAIVSNAPSSEVSLLSRVGVGVGSLFVSVALIFLLGYLDLFDAAGWESDQHRRTLVATIIPLAVVFAAIVFFQAFQVLQPGS